MVILHAPSMNEGWCGHEEKRRKETEERERRSLHITCSKNPVVLSIKEGMVSDDLLLESLSGMSKKY